MTEQGKKHALITGAGRGIGAAVSERLAAGGYNVTLLGRDLANLEQQASIIGDAANPLVCDITDPHNVASAFSAATNRFGTIDVLVNNAGAASTAPFLKASPEQLQSMLDVNYLGACYCIQQALATMLERNSGRIINIGSSSSVKGYPYVSAYSAAKHALMGMTRSLALEIAGSKVTINTVCPGFTETDIVSDAIQNIIEKTGRTEQQAIAELTKHNPQKRFVQVSEVAEQVFYLAEHAPQSVNGQAIMLDGGETA